MLSAHFPILHACDADEYFLNLSNQLLEKTNSSSCILNALAKNFAFSFINRSVKMTLSTVTFSTHKFIALSSIGNLTPLCLKISLELLISIAALQFLLFVNIFVIVLWSIFKIRFFSLKCFVIS